MKKSFRAGSIWALLLIVSLILAACGETATPTTAPAAPTATTAMVDATATTAMVDATATTAMVDATATTGGGTSTGKITKVGLVTDVGSINDKSFNQSSWEGAQQGATAVGAEAKFIETKDPKDYSANIDQLQPDRDRGLCARPGQRRRRHAAPQRDLHRGGPVHRPGQRRG
jgi:basic membrane lipoprotein Med (substrate-binding protein (PBP1-ABC) superfamily)